MQEFFIDSDGIKLHAKLELPEGAPERCPLCIVQHGLTGHMEENHIVAVAAALREVGVATLRVEMYGHGKSGGSFARHTLLKWIDNMLDVVDYAQGLDWVTDLYLCGHSQGGLLVMLVAALRPYAFKAIIPMSPAIVIVENALKGNLFGMPFDPVKGHLMHFKKRQQPFPKVLVFCFFFMFAVFIPAETLPFGRPSFFNGVDDILGIGIQLYPAGHLQ